MIGNGAKDGLEGEKVEDMFMVFFNIYIFLSYILLIMLLQLS